MGTFFKRPEVLPMLTQAEVLRANPREKQYKHSLMETA
jgi:hypothetical protein